MERRPINLSPPVITEAEVEAVSAVLRSGWLTHGPRTQEFEEKFRSLVGAEHVLAASSGTAALHLALAAADVGPGDEVVTTPLTFAATTEAVLYQRAVPVFADVDPVTGNLDPAAVREKMTEKTKAVLPIHLGGHPADMTAFEALCSERGLFLVDDAAHAVETLCRGRRVGTLGDATCFSFYVNKNLTTGEGGMLATRHESWARRAAVLRLHGMDRDAWDRYAAGGTPGYDIIEPGYKYNTTDIASALGLVQLSRIDEHHRRRLELVAAYDEALAGLPGIELPPRPEAGSGDRHAWHLYVVRVIEGECPIGRDELAGRLRELGVATSVHYHPLHLMTLYRREFGGREGQFPEAERLGRERLTLPFSAAYGPEVAREVARRMRAALEKG
jgi:dTDP-4-amino-4,6-dideoxygalactose transaminase